MERSTVDFIVPGEMELTSAVRSVSCGSTINKCNGSIPPLNSNSGTICKQAKKPTCNFMFMVSFHGTFITLHNTTFLLQPRKLYCPKKIKMAVVVAMMGMMKKNMDYMVEKTFIKILQLVNQRLIQKYISNWPRNRPIVKIHNFIRQSS